MTKFATCIFFVAALSSAVVEQVSAQSVGRSFSSTVFRLQFLIQDAIRARLLAQETLLPRWTLLGKL